MPFWHGIFSLGAVAGALAGALAASLGLPVAWQLPVVSLVLAVAMWLATRLYIPDAGMHPGTPEPVDEPIFDEPQVIASDQGALSALRKSSISGSSSCLDSSICDRGRRGSGQRLARLDACG